MASIVSAEYNWNILARRLASNSLFKKSETGESPFEDETPPCDPEEGNKLVVDNELNHGDVIYFEDYRDALSHIVYRQDDGRYTWIENPDDSGSGYLTIPEEILQTVTDAVGKYRDIIRDSPSVSLHPSRDDVYIKEKIGDVPEDWKFNLIYNWGELEEIYVRTTDCDWVDFDLKDARKSVEKTKAYFEGAKEEQSSFVVKLSLMDEKFEEFKEKYGRDSWISAKPDYPDAWQMESGGMSGGSSTCKREWRFKGPKQQEEETKQAVSRFLEGFDHTIVDSDPADF